MPSSTIQPTASAKKSASSTSTNDSAPLAGEPSARCRKAASSPRVTSRSGANVVGGGARRDTLLDHPADCIGVVGARRDVDEPGVGRRRGSPWVRWMNVATCPRDGRVARREAPGRRSRGDRRGRPSTAPHRCRTRRPRHRRNRRRRRPERRWRTSLRARRRPRRWIEGVGARFTSRGRDWSTQCRPVGASALSDRPSRTVGPWNDTPWRTETIPFDLRPSVDSSRSPAAASAPARKAARS